jgi:hypothetical protein
MQHRLLNWTAALFVLTTCACSRAKEHTKGFPMYISDVEYVCGDGHPLVVTALGSHRFTINYQGVTDKSGLISSLNDQLRYLAVKVLYLRAEPGASYSDFIEMTDAVYHPDIRIAIITHHSAFNQYGGCTATAGAIPAR